MSYTYQGHTAHAVKASADLGVSVAPGQLTALKPFQILTSLVSQAFYRTDTTEADRQAILSEAEKQLDVLRVAVAAAESIMTEATEAITDPEPASK